MNKVVKIIDENITMVAMLHGDGKDKALQVMCGKVLMASELGALTQAEACQYIDVLFDLIKENKRAKKPA